MQLTLHAYTLRTKHPFTISRGTSIEHRTLIVELQQDGVSGYGESNEYTFYGATMDNMIAALEAVRPRLAGMSLTDPARLWQELNPELSKNRFAQNALDQAAHDLWGKLRGAPVWKLWGYSLEGAAPTDYTLGIDTIEKLIAKYRERPDFPIYKIKLGTDHDLEIVRALRAETQAVFRVDANCAWTAAETIEKSKALKELGVEFIEQPMPREAWADMDRVYREVAIPVIADESCQTEEDVDRCRGLFHGINVKLPKCGGLTPGRRMLESARKSGMKTMIGCFSESSVGISAGAQLLPLLDYVDLDGILLLAEDIAAGVTVDRGRIIFPEENGCGVRLLNPAPVNA